MKKYNVVAYPDGEGNKRQEAVIEAENDSQAKIKAWKMFPEYHEVGVYEVEEER